MTADKNPPSEYDFLGTDGLRPEDVGHVDEWHSMALDLLEGTLPPHVAAPLEAHVATCPDCRRALAEQRSMTSLLRAVPEVTVPGDLEHAVLAGLAGLSESEPAAANRDASGRTRVKGGALQSLRRLLTVRVWLPAAAVVLVAGIALSSYVRMDMDSDEGVSRMATESAQKDAAVAPPEGAAGDDSAFQSAPSGVGAQTTGAGAAPTTTAMATETLGAAAPIVVLTVGLPGDDPDTVALRVEDLTGLEPLPRDSWMGGRTTYAALIATDEVATLAAGLGAVGSETLPFAEYAVRVPPSPAEVLGQGAAANTLPVLTPRNGDAASAGRSWLPDRDAAHRSGAESDLTIVVITLGTTALR
jgi:hypothetical protein